VKDLQQRSSGPGDKLNYKPGHTIDTKYKAYKTAQKSASKAGTSYKKTADSLKATKPYKEKVHGPVKGNKYSSAGHKTLAPLAGKAATAAKS
jgi:hypothetical protein